jgi:GNAT superfamily N-acetyltransferase
MLEMLSQIRSQMLASRLASSVEHDAAGCFQVFTAPDNTRVWENMALTTAELPLDETALRCDIAALEACFETRGRAPRLEAVHEMGDALIPILEVLGWVTEGVYPVYACQPASAPEIASVAGIQTVAILDDAPVSSVQAMMQIGERAFENPDAPLPTADVALASQVRWRGMPKVMAYIDGVPVGSGMLTLPVNGCSELAGICTLEDYRGRGVATQVVAHLIRIAREREITLAYLTAADDAAARIYMRAGFVATGLLQTNIGKPARGI